MPRRWRMGGSAAQAKPYLDQFFKYLEKKLGWPERTGKGEYFEVDSARIWDIPEIPVAIATAVSGDRSVDMFAPLSDHLIAVEPNKDLVDAWHDARRATGLPGNVRVIGQIPICWDPDRDTSSSSHIR